MASFSGENLPSESPSAVEHATKDDLHPDDLRIMQEVGIFAQLSTHVSFVSVLPISCK